MPNDHPDQLDAVELTADGALTLGVAARMRTLVEPWLPAHRTRGAPRNVTPSPADGATIVVREAFSVTDCAAGGERAVAATFGPVLIRTIDRGLDLDTGTATHGRVDLVARQAVLVGDPDDLSAADTMPAMLTIAAAALLGRLSRALVHAAAVVAPDGRAWLLAGDTHAGKSTTTATLLEAGWRYCSDDHVVLSSDGADGLVVEGWPRVLHLDDGWADGAPVGGERSSVDAFARWPGRWQRSAPVGGVLLPTVVGDAPSRLVAASAADRLAMLVRQAPWLFVDAAGAGPVLALLQRAAELPGARLELGRDTFRRGDRLREVLRAVV